MVEVLFYGRVHRWRRGFRLYVPAAVGRRLRHGGRLWLEVDGEAVATRFYSMRGTTAGKAWIPRRAAERLGRVVECLLIDEDEEPRIVLRELRCVFCGEAGSKVCGRCVEDLAGVEAHGKG